MNLELETQETDTEQMLQRIAAKAKQLRLESALLFVLEAHMPLTGLAHTIGLLFQPVVSPLIGASRMHQFLHLMSERQHLERLMQLLEQNTLSQSHG